MFKKSKSLFVVVVILLSSFIFSSAVFAVEKPKNTIEAFDQVEPLMGDFLFKMHSQPFKLGKPKNSIYGYSFVYEGKINWPDLKYRLLYEDSMLEMLEYLYYMSPYDREYTFHIYVECSLWFKNIKDPYYVKIDYRMNEEEYKQLKTEEIFIQKFLKDTNKIHDRKKIIDEAYSSIMKSSFAKKYRNRIFMRCLARKGIKSELTFIDIPNKRELYPDTVYAGIYVDNYIYDLYFDAKMPFSSKELTKHAVEKRLHHENKPDVEKILKKIPFN